MVQLRRELSKIAKSKILLRFWYREWKLLKVKPVKPVKIIETDIIVLIPKRPFFNVHCFKRFLNGRIHLKTLNNGKENIMKRNLTLGSFREGSPERKTDLLLNYLFVNKIIFKFWEYLFEKKHSNIFIYFGFF